jgi:hypothetical protein
VQSERQLRSSARDVDLAFSFLEENSLFVRKLGLLPWLFVIYTSCSPYGHTFAQGQILKLYWLKPGAAIFHAQAHIPTQPTSPLKDARLSHAYEDQERPGGDLAPAGQRSQTSGGEARLP